MLRQRWHQQEKGSIRVVMQYLILHNGSDSGQEKLFHTQQDVIFSRFGF